MRILITFIIISIVPLFYSCSNQIYFSGVNEFEITEFTKINSKKKLTIRETINILGQPQIYEKESNMMIYYSKKDIGSDSLKKNVFHRVIKLYFDENEQLDDIKILDLN